MTQTQVGDAIGVSCVTIGRYESGEREPSNAKISALADYFGVSIDYLMGRDESKNENYPSMNELLLAVIPLFIFCPFSAFLCVFRNQ